MWVLCQQSFNKNEHFVIYRVNFLKLKIRGVILAFTFVQRESAFKTIAASLCHHCLLFYQRLLASACFTDTSVISVN